MPCKIGIRDGIDDEICVRCGNCEEFNPDQSRHCMITKEDRVGMGRNRREIVHEGMRVMCLCRTHHDEAHIIGQQTFNARHHVYGIVATKEICAVYKLRANEEEICG
ncbi:MAG: putative HNHc nuclease [Defluviitaleaceae bacterium]|nr:putative HNHc nuclease [Defluviitaleaceae bacterium]